MEDGKGTGRKGTRFFLLPTLFPTQSEERAVSGISTHARKALMGVL